jgi:transcriptional regulator GlxA family with amidase domain
MQVSTEPEGTCDFDTILIGVGMDIPYAPPGIISYVKEASRTTRRLASICLASFVLGAAGLLQKRPATTHWRFADEFQRRFPETRVEIARGRTQFPAPLLRPELSKTLGRLVTACTENI